MLGSPESKPAFLSDKALEPVIKNIVRKFPTVDAKSSSVSAVVHQFINHKFYIYDIFTSFNVFRVLAEHKTMQVFLVFRTKFKQSVPSNQMSSNHCRCTITRLLTSWSSKIT